MVCSERQDYQQLSVKERIVSVALILWMKKELKRGKREFDVTVTGGEVADSLMYWLKTTDGEVADSLMYLLKTTDGDLERIMPEVVKHFTGEEWEITVVQETGFRYPGHLKFQRR